MLQPWHDFFLLTGTAAATLLGLVFVAGSIAATIPNERLGDETSRYLWVAPIIVAFTRVLVVSTLGVIPGESGATFGIIVSLLALLDLTRMVWVIRGLHDSHRRLERLTPGDWWWYGGFPLLATF